VGATPPLNREFANHAPSAPPLFAAAELAHVPGLLRVGLYRLTETRARRAATSQHLVGWSYAGAHPGGRCRRQRSGRRSHGRCGGGQRRSDRARATLKRRSPRDARRAAGCPRSLRSSSTWDSGGRAGPRTRACNSDQNSPTHIDRRRRLPPVTLPRARLLAPNSCESDSGARSPRPRATGAW
jgi:hypothetical protein